jgi:hypothetical protein
VLGHYSTRKDETRTDLAQRSCHVELQTRQGHGYEEFSTTTRPALSGPEGHSLKSLAEPAGLVGQPSSYDPDDIASGFDGFVLDLDKSGHPGETHAKAE